MEKQSGVFLDSQERCKSSNSQIRHNRVSQMIVRESMISESEGNLQHPLVKMAQEEGFIMMRPFKTTFVMGFTKRHPTQVFDSKS